MACCLFGAKPLSDPMLAYCQLDKLHWDFNQNWNIFIPEKAFENDVCEKVAILSLPQCIKKRIETRKRGYVSNKSTLQSLNCLDCQTPNKVVKILKHRFKDYLIQWWHFIQIKLNMNSSFTYIFYFILLVYELDFIEYFTPWYFTNMEYIYTYWYTWKLYLKSISFNF